MNMCLKNKLLCMLLICLAVISLASCGSQVGGSETADSSEETTERTEPETSGDEAMPAPLLKEGDSVTRIEYIEAVRIVGGDKLYTVRLALFDTANDEATGKGCYFDAVDPESNSIIAYRRMTGASTLSYYREPTNGTLTVMVTGLSYMKTKARLSFETSFFCLSTMSELGETIIPDFIAFSRGKGFSANEVYHEVQTVSRLQLVTLNAISDIANELDEAAELGYVYLMSNDSAFLKYCGDRTPTVSLLFELWDKEIDSLTSMMLLYGIW